MENTEQSLIKPRALDPDIRDAILQNYHPDTHGVVFNFSGHPIPRNFSYFLDKYECKTFSRFDVDVHVEPGADLWQECLRFINELQRMTCPLLEEPSLRIPGKKFMFVPAKSDAGIMLFRALSIIKVTPPYLVRVAYQEKRDDFAVTSIINMAKFENFTRSNRMKLCGDGAATAGLVENKVVQLKQA